MNKVKKILALVCCAVLLVCISVGATLAYLTSKTEVAQNTFTVGKVAIKLDEAKVNEYGKPVDNDGKEVDLEKAPRVLTNEYKLMPGHIYTKDPTITVLGDSEPSYIRMFVTITDYADVEAVLGPNFLPQNFVNGTWESDIWLTTNEVMIDTVNNTATYEFRYHEIVSTVDGAEKKLVPLFDEIEIPGTVDNDNLAKLDKMQINIVGYAMQADGFDTAADAWKAYDKPVDLPVPPVPVPSDDANE